MRINEGKKLSDKEIKRIIDTMSDHDNDQLLPEDESQKTPEEELDIIDAKIAELSIIESTLIAIMYIISTVEDPDNEDDPLTFPRTIKQRNEFTENLDIKTELDIKKKIVKLYTNNEFKSNDSKTVGKNIILGGVCFIAKNNMYNHKYLNIIIRNVKNRVSQNNNSSYNNLKSVYMTFEREHNNYIHSQKNI
tara:strand:- start:312 stop:887 length:576 start_codon:yes stop_codon:yes gene_type:complete